MPRPFSFSDEQVHLIAELYHQGWTSTQAANILNLPYTARQIVYALRKFGYPVRAPGRPQNKIPVSSIALELITGHLLGDGHLTPIKPPLLNSSFGLVQSRKHADVITWTQEILNRHNIPGKVYEKKTDGAFVLYTPHAPFFTQLRHLWYPLEIKIIPSDLVLTPLALLAWYLGDGSLNKHAGVMLYTQGFTFDNVYRLQQCMLECFGLLSTIRKRYYSENSWAKNRRLPRPMLYLPKSKGNRERFFSIIGPCPVPSMQHKWPDQ